MQNPVADTQKTEIMAQKRQANKAEFRRLGGIFLDRGLITINDVERILYKQNKEDLRFGDAALQLDLISQAELDQALFYQFSYSQLDAKTSKVSREVVAAFSPNSEQVEGLRVLRSQLVLRWFSEDQKTLSIISSNEKEGKSYIAANLATLFTQLGEKTLLIDGNMREPRLHNIFNLNNQAGLSTALSGRDDVPACQEVEGLAALYVLPAGPPPPNPQELISRAKFCQLIRQLKKDYDIILIDTPASKKCSDALMITSMVDGALVVTRRNKTSLADIKRLKKDMEADHVTIVGSILNR